MAIGLDPRTGWVGREVGGYTILKELGEGGMGLVFLAEHRLLGRKAAIKTIRPEVAQDDTFSRRFQLEARAVAALDHPGIVRVYDFAFEEGVPYIVMEWVQGESLEAVLANAGRLPPKRVLELLWPAAAGLDHAHNHGIVHRDVKPANILLADDGRTLLMDFGLARLAGFTLITSPDAILGTPDYIAPEQLTNAALDGRADIYSFACVVYEAVTGQKPFPGKTWIDVASRRLVEPPPIANGVPEPFARTLAEAMAREPLQRPPKAALLLDELAAALGGNQPVVVGPM